MNIESKSRYKINVKKWQENNCLKYRLLQAKNRALKKNIEFVEKVICLSVNLVFLEAFQVGLELS
jgi:hypothetical protein